MHWKNLIRRGPCICSCHPPRCCRCSKNCDLCGLVRYLRDAMKLWAYFVVIWIIIWWAYAYSKSGVFKGNSKELVAPSGVCEEASELIATTVDRPQVDLTLALVAFQPASACSMELLPPGSFLGSGITLADGLQFSVTLCNASESNSCGLKCRDKELVTDCEIDRLLSTSEDVPICLLKVRLPVGTKMAGTSSLEFDLNSALSPYFELFVWQIEASYPDTPLNTSSTSSGQVSVTTSGFIQDIVVQLQARISVGVSCHEKDHYENPLILETLSECCKDLPWIYANSIKTFFSFGDDVFELNAEEFYVQRSSPKIILVISRSASIELSKTIRYRVTLQNFLVTLLVLMVFFHLFHVISEIGHSDHHTTQDEPVLHHSSQSHSMNHEGYTQIHD